MEEQKVLLHVQITSFSFKKGIPEDPTENGGGFVFDCRAIPNPGTKDEYKSLTGMQQPVIDYLENIPETAEFKQYVFGLAHQSIKRYLERNFSHLMINFGCTGGQHRSVYFAEQTAAYIKQTFGISVSLQHREQNVYKEF